MSKKTKHMQPRGTVRSVVAMAACLFLWAAVCTFDPGDWPSPNQFPHHSPTHNACGLVGAWFSYQARYFLGDGVFPILLFATLACFMRLARGEIGNLFDRVIGIVLVAASTAASSHLIAAPSAAALPVGNGGLAGYALGELMRSHFSGLGTTIVISCSLLVGLVFATEGWVLTLPGLVRRAGATTGRGLLDLRARMAAIAVARPAPVASGVTSAESAALLRVGRRKRTKIPVPSEELDDEADGSEEVEASDTVEETEEFDETVEVDGEVVDDGYKEEGCDEDEADEDDSGESAQARQANLQKARNAAALIINSPSTRKMSQEAYPSQIENWRLPEISLLEEPQNDYAVEQEAVVRAQAAVLEQTLQEFRLNAHVVEIDTGPVITMFELRLGAGIKVSQIASLANDIARALKAHAIRVVAPISGKNTVGIEVPNASKEKVHLRELMTLAGGRASDMGLPLFLGKDAGGAALVADLTKMPHVLIAGTTGSGKSVCLNTIILSMLMTKRPDHVKMILVDPKMVEMSQYKDVPHLMCPIVTDMHRAEKILEWSVTKMDERYSLLAEARVKNIQGYNNLTEEELLERLSPENEEEKKRIPKHMPFIVIIIDELADLMMTAAKEVEHSLSRLAQKSRAVGIHIVVATQRPEAKVVTGLIKSNLPSRVCFRVASRMDSRIVLDQNGGEVLMGQGDLLFLPPGLHKLIRAQGTYLDDAEIAAVLDDLASRAQPEFHPELERIRKTGAGDNDFTRDPLFDDAVRIILESKRGSVSLLQRRLTIGYSRASRLIDQMAEAGIVGDYKGSQAREVLLTLDEWDAMRRQVEADMKQGYEADEEDDDEDGNVPDLLDDQDVFN